MAGGHAHVLGLRNGSVDSRLVHPGRDRLGRCPHSLRFADVRRHAGGADVRRVRRSHRPSQPAGRHARGLCGAGDDDDDAGAHRADHAGLRLHPGVDPRAGPPLRPRPARCIGRQHHAACVSGQRSEPVAHHHGYRAHRRRPDRRRHVRRARHGASLCADCLPLPCQHHSDTVHFTGLREDVDQGGSRNCARLAMARSVGRARLYLEHAAHAGGDVDRVPGQPHGLSLHRQPVALHCAQRASTPTRPGSAICRQALRSARWLPPWS